MEVRGGIDVPAIVDQISWTEEVVEFAGRDDLSTRTPNLILTGEATEKAIIGFKEAGWQLSRP